MIQLIWLRALGACVALVLAVHAGLAFYGDLVRPEFRASGLFLGQTEPAGASTPGGFAARLSFDGDLLANVAAVIAARVLRHPAIDAKGRAEENETAQDALIAALRVSPIRPASWLALATLRMQSGEAITPALKMSYLTGSVPVEVAFSRIQSVTSTQAASDEEIRLLAQFDIRAALASRSRFEAPLIATYVQATAEGKSLLLESTQALDPGFNSALRRY
jgi:hypothetical protein